MRIQNVKKVMVLDQGHPVFYQLMTRAKELFGGQDTEFIRADCTGVLAEGICVLPQSCVLPEGADMLPEGGAHGQRSPAGADHMAVIGCAEQMIRRERPDLVLIGATALGEEAAPALGVRLGSGVAAHCTQIRVTEEGRIAFMVPAFGGKVVGEIFIPRQADAAPAIATVKPGMFEGDEESAGDFRTVTAAASDVTASDAAASDDAGRSMQGSVRLTGVSPVQNGAEALDKAKLIFCGGFGIGSEENWKKIEELAARAGGAAGCTRPVVDMGWGPDEGRMSGTSGRTVKPKVYIGFGISGAAHHLCGIQDADVIVSINNDKEAEIFAASDYAGVFDAGSIMDALLERL